MASNVEILLAAFNGARFLPQMLASLDAQHGGAFHVLVRDDGSSDDTTAILSEWAGRSRHRVTILPTVQPSGSPQGNFSHLMNAATADYVLFADQDDIWFPDKVSATIDALRAAEIQVGGPGLPVLVFCDLSLIDQDGRQIHASMRGFQRMNVESGVQFERLLLHNSVTGCAMGVNRAALDAGRPVPAEAVMHDWWLALVCAGLGLIRPMPQCLIGYRQHGGNVIGAQNRGMRDALPGLRRLSGILANIRAYRRWLNRLCLQAAALENRHGGQLSPRKAAALAAFASIRGRGMIARRLLALRYGFKLESTRQTIAFLLRL